MKHVLVTGGMGYIGSHTVISLLESGFNPVIVDNLSNSNKEVINRIFKITGKMVPFEQVDLCDRSKLKKVFIKYSFDSVIHFAGLKSVGESVKNPLQYYTNNLISTLNLCELMEEYKAPKLVFSSSATVYGDPESVPISETAPTSATNPYGQTKLMIEQILKDWVASNSHVSVTCLRYFNPIGAHKSGLIGEDPSGIPNNLLPYISQVAVGKLKELKIYGGDYSTPDGTGVRDYIHVLDLADGHVAALSHMPKPGEWLALNLGTGIGNSVLQAVKAFENASGVSIPYQIVSRRPGDIATCYADVSKAKKLLQWAAKRTFEEGCQDAWNWQKRNPKGF